VVDLLRCRVVSIDTCFCLSEHQAYFLYQNNHLVLLIPLCLKESSPCWFFCGYQSMLRNREKMNYRETSGLKPAQGFDSELKEKAISSPVKSKFKLIKMKHTVLGFVCIFCFFG